MKIAYTLFAVVVLAALSITATAGEHTQHDHDARMVIALETDEFVLPETDISHLAEGEAETVVTESGTVVDLLRTGDGVEVYVDGDLIAPAIHDDHGPAGHKEVEIHCDDAGQCEKFVRIGDVGNGDELLESEGQPIEKVIIVREEIEQD